MKLQTKLLILLLTIALIPLSLSFLTQRTSLLHFGNKLADDTRELLNSRAVTLLHTLVDDYGRILKRDKAMALLTLKIQAQAVEKRISAPLPSRPQPIYFSDDYASVQKQPEDLTTTSKRQRPTKDGTLIPISVSFSEQVIFLAGEKKPKQVADELKQMSSMPEVYQTLHAIQPDLFLWHYTSLESGLHSSYPGKGGYPDDYDPRQRQWYKDAVAKGEPTQKILTDLTTGNLIMTLATPIHNSDGKIAGVTALDIDYRQFFADWIIPVEWRDTTESMILVYHEEANDPTQKLEVLLRSRTVNQTADWRIPVEHEYLDITAPSLRELQQDLLDGNSAVRKIVYQGEEALWAYGSRLENEPFPLVVVPNQQVFAKAVDAENYINQQISLVIKINAALTVIVVAAAILLAISRSRKVTRPILQLVNAAKRLSEGVFETRVDINTGDEIEKLGDVFNSMGARLKEREQMLQSLALAREIQQQLLPDAVPECDGFDLAGKSIYCDETGGDYFDFITLKNSAKPYFGLAVGDVSGHGIGAALVMATARGVLHSLVERHGDKLEPLCHELNYHLCQSTSHSYFMTLFYGVLNPVERSLCWLSAGHAPIFLYRADGKVEELYSTGIPLGIIEDTTYHIAPLIKFSPGDTLLIGTDGIWETQNATGEMFGSKRVCDLLARHATGDADSISEQIISELNRFRGDQMRDDDITLVVIKAK